MAVNGVGPRPSTMPTPSAQGTESKDALSQLKNNPEMLEKLAQALGMKPEDIKKLLEALGGKAEGAGDKGGAGGGGKADGAGGGGKAEGGGDKGGKTEGAGDKGGAQDVLSKFADNLKAGMEPMQALTKAMTDAKGSKTEGKGHSSESSFADFAKGLMDLSGTGGKDNGQSATPSLEVPEA